MMVWNLSNEPFDSKGALFTQTLVGIDRIGGLHWRGERNLEKFRDAFEGLLGAEAKPPTKDLENMESFILALRNPPPFLKPPSGHRLLFSIPFR